MLALLSAAGTGAAELDPAAVVFKLPDQINWKENATAGNANAVLYGDPSKPGLYIVLVKWHAGHMSHPHFHPNDRFITVISGQHTRRAPRFSTISVRVIERIDRAGPGSAALGTKSSQTLRWRGLDSNF